MDDFRVSFIPTENCNLKCYYCSRNCQVPVNDFCSVKDFENIVRFVEMQERKLVWFEFFGGEPTTHPDLLEMTKLILSRVDTDVIIATNTLMPLDYYLSFPDRVKFSCTYHSHGIGPDEWEKKISALHNRGMTKDIKYIMTPENEQHIVDVYRQYEDSTFEMYEIILLEQLDGSDWAESVYKKYEMFEVDYIGEYKPRNSYKGMMCCAGFQISPNGNLFRCRSAYNTGKPITNLFTGEIKKLDQWHLCPYDKCDVNDVEFDKMAIRDYIKRR